MTVRRADDTQYILAQAASTTGSDVIIKGGEYAFMVNGTIGGATISLQVKMPDGTYATVHSLNGNVDVSTTSLPYAAASVDLPAGSVRMGVSGGSPSNLNAYLVGLG
jgi:predicted AlkP superfamily phosphohydrolase/phosphomutase